MSIWKFLLVTFGCKVNQYETQSLREAWQKLGGVECSSPAEADVICVNSCAITSKGERDARNAVFRLRREAPKARLILTGCAARLFADYKPRPGATWAAPDLLVAQEHKDTLLQGPWVTPSFALHNLAPDSEQSAEKTAVKKTQEKLPEVEKSTSTVAPEASAAAQQQAFPPFAISTFKRARPVLKVQDGCAHRCTYCIVPLTRGRPHSRPAEDIIAEARRLLEAGHVEIMISGINLGQYGRGNEHMGDFWNLLRTLDAALAPEFAGQARFRISSLEPGQLNERGLDIIRGCSLLCPHLHISLQHGSQSVLKRMGRGHYTAAMLEKAVTSLAAHWPVMGLGADIIAGFPGETEDDVQELLALIERLPLSYAHVFPYSRRPGTAAERFDQQVPNPLKLERAARIRQAVAQKQRDFLDAQLSLPHMLLAADVSGMGHNTPQQHPVKQIKGVNEYYAACFMNNRPNSENESSLPSPALQANAGLLAVRPVDVTDKGLLVEKLPVRKGQD
ncbi:MiaB/RimO family radical SAM methylthiotransferase [Desulfovibrio intestinalis]|uniref:MiaB/RimO family radical SAM methylthiotransferase n=1 Tax=Desulfovibrio intestinalis TaxID=58621 RepID=A0A7W8C1U2_9BACT|nr:radical SAM protein [Desulfovibrio intestinalis]MBB5142887.1 MiaB/RimO family radical SAM methylthiotransferase [Desulfovibrio intestinalis]